MEISVQNEIPKSQSEIMFNKLFEQYKVVKHEVENARAIYTKKDTTEVTQ